MPHFSSVRSAASAGHSSPPRLWIGLVLGALILPSSIRAQTTDNPIVPRGEIRITFAPEFRLASERLGPLGVEALDIDWDARLLGTGFAPIFSPLETAIRTATGEPTFDLSLGRGAAQITAMETRVPFGLAVGIHDRVTLGVTVPLVRGRYEASADVAGLDGGNVGWNPSQSDPTGVQGALAALAGTATAAQAAADQVCTAQGAGSTDCTSAMAAAGSAGGLSADMATLYDGFVLFPSTGSASADALHARLEAVRVALDALGVTGLPVSFPLAAALGDGDLETLARDVSVGARFQDFGNWRGGWGLGDIEATASFLLLRHRDPDGFPVAELSAGATARLATGEADDPDRLFQSGRGSGYTEIGGFAHIFLGSSRLGLEGDVRFARGSEGEVPVRVAPIGAVLVGFEQSTMATLAPGNRIRIGASPRLRLTRELAIAGRYSYERIDAIGYQRVSAEGPDPSILDQGAATTVQYMGGGLVYASPGSVAQGSPMEVRVQVDAIRSGEGFGQPAPLRASLEIRMFRRLFGGE